MKTTVYIETTIPSYYYNTREDMEQKVCSQWTREWWDARRMDYDLVTSAEVLAELRGGNHPLKKEKIALLDDVRILPFAEEVAEIVRVYITRKVMPNDPLGDAFHMAMSSFYKCDFLLSWNCRHIVNYRKAEHVRRVNQEMGLSAPRLVTPFDLLSKELSE